MMAATWVAVAGPALGDEPEDVTAAVVAPSSSGTTLAADTSALTAPEAPTLLEIGVRSPPRRRDPGRTTVTAEEGRSSAGSRDDAVRVVENLPGVARGGFFGGPPILWGAAAGDSRILIDGMEVPALYHGGGLRGVLPSSLVQSVELVPGSYGADYGRALGGLVRVATKDLPAEGLHGSLGADFMDAAAFGSAAVGKGVRVALAGRASYFDKVVDAVAPGRSADALPIPRYHDVQLKVAIPLREDEELTALALGSADALDRTQLSGDPAKVRTESTTSSFYRYQLRYARTFADGSVSSVAPYVGQDSSRTVASFGGAPQVRDNLSWRYGLRASHRMPVAKDLVLVAGLDALVTRSSLFRQGSLALPPREGDRYVFGQLPGADVGAEHWATSIVNVAPNLFAEWRLGRFLIVPGVRADAFLVETDRKTPRVGATPTIGGTRLLPAVDPRLSVSFNATDDVSLSIAGGLYHQAPSPEDLSAVFGTPALVLSRASHVSAATAVRFPAGFDVQLTGFFEQFGELVVRSRLPNPLLSRALTQDGEGRSYGGQVLARRQLGEGFHGWVAYTLSRSERRYRGDATARLFDADQTHVLTATVAYDWRGWGFAARFRVASGAPRTPVVDSYYDATNARFQPVFGVQNGVRLPAFAALDVRVQKGFDFGRTRLVGYLDVTNVTNHDNAEEFVYAYDYKERGVLLGLPTVALAGARIEL